MNVDDNARIPEVHARMIGRIRFYEAVFKFPVLTGLLWRQMVRVPVDIP